MLRLSKTGRRTSFGTRAGFLAAVAAATMLALPPTTANAHSSKPHPFKEASIAFVSKGGDGRNQPGDNRDTRPELRVGHDGSNYTHLDGHVTATFQLKAKVKSGHRIKGWVITTGDPEDRRDLSDDLKGAEDNVVTRSLDTHATFTMDAETAVSTGEPGISLNRVQDIIDNCNAKFPEVPENDQGIEETELTVHAGFSAGEKEGFSGVIGGDWFPGNASSRPAIAETVFNVNIVCAGKQFRSAGEAPPPRAGNTLHSIDLKVSQKGERCPKDVTVTAYANYKWQATSRMRMAVNGGLPKMRVAKTKKLTLAGKTFHRAEGQFKFKLDPGQKTFKLTVDRGDKVHSETVEIKCPPFNVTSAWLKHEVEDTPVCPKKVKETATFHTTRPGWVNHEIRMPGGLVVSSGKLTAKRVGDKYVATATRNLTMNAIDKEFMADAVDYPANSGWMPLKVECLDLKGQFSFVDKGSPKCSRTARALISFKTNRPENIHYSVDCTNGQHLSGYVKPVVAPQGGYVAAAVKSFGIDKTTVYSCALKTVQPGPVKLHQWNSHTFDCVHRAVETGSNDIQVDPKPTDDAPNRSPANLVKTAPDPANDAAKRDRLNAKKRADEARRKVQAEKRRKARIAAQKAAKEKAKREAAIKARQRKLKAEAAKRAARAAALARQKAQAKQKAKKRSERSSRRQRRAATSGPARARVMRLR